MNMSETSALKSQIKRKFSYHEERESTQQTFVLMKTPFVFVFGRRLDQDEYVRLSLTSSEDVFKTSSRRLGQDQYIRLGYTSSGRLQDVLQKGLQDIFKTSSRRIIKLNCSF